MKYVALIRKEPDTDYWIDVPDISGCASSGETEDQAMDNFQDALEMHIEAMVEEGLQLSKPRSKEEIIFSEEFSYLKAYIIDIDMPEAA